ncbi:MULTISPECIES: hypothetical protein [unclassified Moraxella]|uniref:hypothetical protein n=1 Tax=unclassified Moraxella TaxID=2685852 RepID=UPI003AF72C46
MTFNFQQEYLAILLPSIPDELAELKEELSEFIYWDDSQFQDDYQAKDSIKFLVEQGLPRQASPYLGFKNYHQSDIMQIQQNSNLQSHHFPIGADGSGNVIFVDMADGQIYLSDHDNNDEVIFINNSLEQLGKCICGYDKGYKSLKDLMMYQAIDNKIGERRDFWQVELAEKS